jgi:RNA polymerase sigma-70 factor (ECF subfamily)
MSADRSASADVEAFESFYLAHFDRVFAFVRARVTEERAQDITGDVFFETLRSFQSKGADVLDPRWLMTLARRRVMDEWRKVGRRRSKWHLVVAATPDSVDLDGAIEQFGQREAVLAVLDELPTVQRAALILRYLDDRTVSEVAAELGRSLSATESVLARARRNFAAAYSNRTDQAAIT